MVNLIEFSSVEYSILGIPAYLFCALSALIISLCLFLVMLSWKKYSIDPHFKCLALSILMMVVSSKLFGCFSGLYRAIGASEKITVETILNTGIVFYGGLIGCLFTYGYLVKRSSPRTNLTTIHIVAAIIPLFHAISRIGCFLGGCCYGIASSGSFSIIYSTKATGTISTEARIPVQLIEAFFNLCIFIYLFALLHKEDWKKKHILERYLFIYSVGRFFIEFLRGDINRGLIAGISFSQFISVLIWLYLIFWRKEKMNRGILLYEHESH